MADDVDNEGKGVGVVGGVGSVALGTAAAAGTSYYMGSRALDNLPADVKSELTKDKIAAAKTAAEKSFTDAHGEQAEAYLAKVKEAYTARKGAMTDADFTTQLAKDIKEGKIEPHLGKSIEAHLKKDAKPEDVYKAGKQAHVESVIAEQDKGLIAKVDTHLTSKASDSAKEAAKKAAEKAEKDGTKYVSAGERYLKNTKDYVEGGTFGKIKAGFKGMGTGGKILTSLLGVGVAVGAGMLISNMRKGSGSQVEQLQARDAANAQVAAAAPSR